MDEATANLGSASHMGTSQLPREAHFVYDYMFRRVPVPVTSFLAIADSDEPMPDGRNASKVTLDLLKESLEPAVVTEDELNRESVQAMLAETFAAVSKGLAEKGASGVSMTVALSDRRRAYIGHVGSGRVFLLHEQRLFDLTPSVQVSPSPEQPVTPPAAPVQQQPHLFSEEAGQQAPPVAPATVIVPAVPPEPRLGAGVQFGAGYNEVEIVPGDVMIMCTDGLWKAIKEDELVENFASAMNVQRATSIISQLAFSRDPSDNATCVAWQYVVPSDKWTTIVRETKSRERRSRVGDGVMTFVLVVILAILFLAGFAIGWRISDTFRKNEKAKQARQEAAAKARDDKRKAAEDKANAQKKAEQQAATQSSQPSSVKTATVVGYGVRLRQTADPKGNIVGLLNNGQVVAVLGDATGTDSKAWSKVQAPVTSAGKTIQGVGYVRNDLLNMSGTASSAPKSSSAPASSSTAPAASSTAPR